MSYSPLSRPLSSFMLQTLLECYIKEMNGSPSNPFTTKSVKSLMRRRMVEIRPYNNDSKLKHAVYLTSLGKAIAEPVYKKGS